MNGRKEEGPLVGSGQGTGEAEVGPEASLGEGEHYLAAPAGFRQEWTNEGLIERIGHALNGRV